MGSEFTDPGDMSDATLYREYQEAKEGGTTLHIDVLQKEICERWEAIVEDSTAKDAYEG